MRRFLPAAFCVLCVMALVGAFAYLTFGVPPAQREAGAWAQKIFYFHVSSAWIALLLFLGGMLAGIGYLSWRDPRMARSGRAMIEVGWVASTLVLVTGPVWARPVWGQWWNWEPRLTSFAFLWLLYAAYQILGPAIADRDKRRTLQAAYAILAFVSVPLVVYSTRFVPESSQLHPVKVELSPRMIAAWGMSLGALTLLFAGLTQLRYRIECLVDAVHDLRVARWMS